MTEPNTEVDLPVPDSPAGKQVLVRHRHDAPLRAFQITSFDGCLSIQKGKSRFEGFPEWVREFLIDSNWYRLSSNGISCIAGQICVGTWIVEDEWGEIHIVNPSAFERLFALSGGE